MAIAIATAAQNASATAGNNISQSFTINSGNLLMVCLATGRDVNVTALTWGGMNLIPWIENKNPTYGWASVSIFVLPDFVQGTSTLVCNTDGYSAKYLSVLSWSGAGSYHYGLSGQNDVSTLLSKTINKDSVDAAILLVRGASSNLSTISGSQVCDYGAIMTGQYSLSSASQVILTQSIGGSDLVTWISIALQPTPVTPITSMSGAPQPIWIN